MKDHKVLKYFVASLVLFGFLGLSFKDRFTAKTYGQTVEKSYEALVIDHQSDRVFAAMDDKKGIDVLHAKTGNILTTVLDGLEVKALAIDEQRRLLAAVAKHTIYLLSLDTLNIVATLPLKEEPTSISIDPALGMMLITTDDNEATIIDMNTYAITRKITISDKPVYSVIDPQLHLAVIAHQTWGFGETRKGRSEPDTRDNVTVLDLATLSVVKTLQAGKEPVQAALNPSIHEVSVADSKSDDITVIDLNTLNIKEIIPSGKHPRALSYNECTTALAVVGGEDKSWMQIIDTGAGVATASYTFGDKIEDVKVHSFANRAFLARAKRLDMIDLPNPLPVLTSITPENALRGSRPTNLTINGQGLLENTEVYLNGIKTASLFPGCGSIQVTVPGNYLQKIGDVEIKAVNPMPDGGASNLLCLHLENPVPQITGLDPANATAGAASLAISVLGTGFFNDTVLSVSGVSRSFTLMSMTEIQLELTSADLEYGRELGITASNHPPGGGESTPLFFTVKSPLEVTITSPLNGSYVNKSITIVKGTFKSATNDVGIVVNGIPAGILGQEWAANGVPLAIGTNTIIATVTDNAGNTAAASVSVNNSDTAKIVRLYGNISSGTTPLQTIFSAFSSFIPVSYQMDFEGDGVIDYAAQSFENITRTYASQGIFYPTLTITDNQGNTYTDTIAIAVLSKTELDTLLKGKWEAMKSALNNKDTEGALGYFVDSSKERYRSIFEALKDQLPAILDTFVEFNITDVYENLAEYEIVANENGVLYSYPGLLVRDRNGIWKFRDF